EFSSCSSLRPSPPLDEGSFGVVWKALHKVTGEIVAIKQLKNEVSRLTSWEEFLQMAEVKSLSQLKNHPNIVNLKQAFMEVDGTASLVFEFMEGNKLRCRKPKPETEMKNRLRSLVVFDDGRANGLVVFDDHRWLRSLVVFDDRWWSGGFWR
ncbi:unnamed protein product, partial [Prunus brigantina]